MLRSLLVVTLGLAAITAQENASNIGAGAYQELRYRLIGPFRASRTVAGVGIPTQPSVFFMGVHTGGVWKTDDYGRTWRPIFDSAPTGSIGDIGVSWSNPDIIYVGTGEGLHRPDLGVGDGIFKSIDGGKSWKHVGLGDVQQVGRLVVHPTNPDIVFVAGLGHPYGANAERGIFRTTNGGATWEKVLFVNENTGGVQVELDPKNPNVVYGSMWEHSEGPWENASFFGPNSGLYKSTDGGTTWRQLKGGLPSGADGAGRICLGIGVNDPNRLYAAVMGQGRGAEGFYRSNDGGESWTLVSKDSRLGLDVRVHPANADVVFVGNIAAYRSDDGGKTWTSIKGAPGGDDYQRIWINPLQPDIMLFTADQGAVVTVNGGRTWSSWYNQPTAQMYHVTTDNQFPYWVYGGQQESGAIGIASRGNGGQISFRDWIGVGADEYAYIAPDPQDANIIYGGRVMRFDRRTGQAQNVAPEALRSGKYRILRTMPLLFHPADPKTLIFATNVLWKTTTGGHELGDHQPGPFARAAGRARERRHLSHAGDEDDAAARGHLRGEPVTTRRQRHLGRNRRWARARDAGWRKDVDERDAAGAARLGQGVADRRRPFRHEHRVHRDQCDPPRRHASAHLSHPRWRPNLDAHRQRHQSRRAGQRRA